MIMRAGNHRSRRHPPRAMLVMSVLVCLALVMTLFAGWIRSVALERRQLRALEDRMQAEYLADCALRRAAAHLKADAAYTGETWRIDAQDFSGRAEGSVTIQVQGVSDDPRARTVRAVADFPADGAARARRSKETKLILPTLGETP